MRTTNRNIFIWGLYDFANSFVGITFLLYFSKWLVVTRGLSDWWYNAVYIFGSIGLAFFAPMLGAKADQTDRERSYLIFSTLGCFGFYAAAIGAAIAGWPIFWPAGFYGLGNFFYQLSFVFYNPLINNISTDQNQGKISGIGFSMNYLGQIGGILISLPLISRPMPLGFDPLVAPLIPALFVFGFFSIPLLLNADIFAAPRAAKEKNVRGKNALELLRLLAGIPGVLWFLLAFFFLSDAGTTLTNNFSIVTTNIFHVSDQDISIVSLLVIAMAAIGSYVWGLLGDRIGPRQSLMVIVTVATAMIVIMAATLNYSVYFFCALITGTSIGGVYAVSRQLLNMLVPDEMTNYAFGIYAISERAATFAGPLIWASFLAAGGYRWAIFSLAILQIFTILALLKLPRLGRYAH